MTIHKLKRSKPSVKQLDAMQVIHFLNTLEQQQIDIHTLVIYKQDAIIVEAEKHPYKLSIPHMSFSLAKGFIATAIGLLYDEKRLSLQDAIIDYFPEYKSMTALNNMTIEDALMMCTGHEKPMFGADFRMLEKDWLDAFVNIGFSQHAGEQFLYNSGTSYLLSALITKITKTTAYEYLKEKLFKPLDMAIPIWEESPEGINTGGWGLYITAEDNLKLGILYLQSGKWNGQQIISEDWVTKATTLKIILDESLSSISSRGYGYHFWCGDDDVYRLDGAYGQLCIIDQKSQSVIVIHAGTPHLQQLRQIVYANLLPALRSSFIENNLLSKLNPSLEHEHHIQADKRLAQYLKEWSYISQDCPINNSKFSNNEQGMYEVISSNTVIHAIKLSYSQEQGEILMYDAYGQHQLCFGFSNYVTCNTSLSSLLHDYYQWEQVTVDSIAHWQEDGRLLITCRYLDKAYVDCIHIEFNSSNIVLTRSVNINSIETKKEEIRAVKAKLN